MRGKSSTFFHVECSTLPQTQMLTSNSWTLRRLPEEMCFSIHSSCQLFLRYFQHSCMSTTALEKAVELAWFKKKNSCGSTLAISIFPDLRRNNPNKYLNSEAGGGLVSSPNSNWRDPNVAASTPHSCSTHRRGGRAPTPLAGLHKQLPLLKITRVNYDSICCFAQMSPCLSQFSVGRDRVTTH